MERAIQLRRRDLPLFGRQSAFAPSPVSTNVLAPRSRQTLAPRSRLISSAGYERNNSINIDKYTMFFDKLTGYFC